MTSTVYYIDSCVFLDFLFSKYRKSNPAKKFFNDYLINSDSAKVSLLTIMEVITSGRRILVENTNDSMPTIDQNVLQSIKFIFSLQNVEFIPSATFNPLSEVPLKQGLGYIQKYIGKIRISRGKRELDGLYAPDCIHLSLAIQSHCDTFVTRDFDFYDVKGREPIRIEILR
jgi:predicted nucleic acid-binding protein